ncbi:hypothetical protein [Nostoc sp.]|uniref:hypothetical protein n=1 Tax=Nostoc sp. TaxID=1180 RepID=UPI002FF5AA51
MQEQIKPGFHEQVQRKLYILSNEEQKILQKFGNEWFVTRLDSLKIGGRSEYKYALIKAPINYQELFNFERELIMIFSDYESFQPRSIDAIDAVSDQLQDLRIDKICSVMLSKDEKIEEKIRNILKESQESQVIVPISYSEILNNHSDSYFLRNKFKTNFYTRDLFDFQSPLKKDLYFFGRGDIINKIVNRHFSNENSGLFGLRKTGKTSVIFGIQRALDKIGEKSILISCDDTSFQQRRWNKCLHYIILEINKKYNLNLPLQTEAQYTEENASQIFAEEICKIYHIFQKKSILIIFDEIERITFNISSVTHWEKNLDFIFFWQTLRANFQKLNNVFSYLIVGTNPLCIEKSSIFGKDNPIFHSIPIEYLPRFDVPQTRDMVRKLGRIMGLQFEEIIYSKLTEDYGGHPFLIRQVCSLIHKLNNPNLPIIVDRITYDKAKNEFDKNHASKYIEMMVSVLSEFYPDEYDLLKCLAIGELKFFNQYASESTEYTNHLKGYGIISQTREEYDFKIDAVKQYLIQKNKYKKVNPSNEDMLNEISQRRNALEPKLRKIVRTQLKVKYGENQAREKLLVYFSKEEQKKYSHLAYKDLFDPDKVNIYLEVLRKIIKEEWLTFEHIFSRKQEEFNLKMEAINKYRADAHAKQMTQDKMGHFRDCITWIETHVNEFLED